MFPVLQEIEDWRVVDIPSVTFIYCIFED